MWAIVINPVSGGGKGASIGQEVVGFFVQRNMEYSIITASREDLLKEALKRFVENFEAGEIICDGIVAVGGDGLVHLTLQAISRRNIPFIIIPAGTGNDFSRALGWHGCEIDEILDFALNNGPVNIDLGLVDSEWFGAILSTGFDSVVNERANKLKWPRGNAKYNAAIALELPRFKPISYHITIDSQEIETEAMLIAVANGRSYGAGMSICPEADLQDGLFDVMILRPVSIPEFLKVFPKVYSGSHVDHPQVDFYRGVKVSISADAVAYSDGERIGQLPVTAECIPGAGLTWVR